LATIHDMFGDQRRDFEGIKRTAFDGGGGDGYDGRMEERVKKLEDLAEKSRADLHAIDLRLAKIDTRMDTFATKTDVAEAKNSIIMWVVGAIFVAQLLPMLKDFVKPTTAPAVPAASAPVKK